LSAYFNHSIPFIHSKQVSKPQEAAYISYYALMFYQTRVLKCVVI